MEAILKLQNGSDVRGVAVAGVEGEPITLKPEYVNKIVQAFVKWLSKESQKPIYELKIAVGHDSRISAEELKAEALKAITGLGAIAIDCGMATTPAMFMSLVYDETKYDGSMMLTASHLPFNRNGIKFFEPVNGGMEKAPLRKVLEVASTLDVVEGDMSKVEKFALVDLYAAKACELIRQGINSKENYEKPLTGMHIVVDAGNGAGGFFAGKVLDPLGADTEGSLYLNPDGHFPNHVPNPEDAKAMAAISGAVLANEADLGLIFDTDVDRMSAVLSDCKEVNRDALIAMMAAILVEAYPGSTIVTDSVTSDKLTTFLVEVLGLKHHRFQRGYKNVINECKRLNGEGIISPLAIETSGHGALKENYYLDDGAYMAVKLLIAAAKARKEGKKLQDLIAKLEPSFEAREYRFKLLGEDFKEYGKNVLEVFTARAKEAGYTIVEPNYEGVRIAFNGEVEGWALLRQSLHDPNMPLNVEGNKAGDCDKIVESLGKLLSGFDQLDISCLKK